VGPDIAVWTICVLTLGGVLLRPRGIREWVWALAGAAALVGCGLVPLRDAFGAMRRGEDVYLFLAGMMVLAELARREGVFDWIAGHAIAAAGGSRFRLFALVYAAGVLVTAVLSNDATAVVLTPAVAAAVRRAKAEPLPHLYACAFVANAASFILPISNPANLIVYGSRMPPLAAWLAAFALPSAVSITATFAGLWWVSRDALRGGFACDLSAPALARRGVATFGGIVFAAVGLVVASAFGAALGAVTLGSALLVLLLVTVVDGGTPYDVVRRVPWSVLLLVAGLFVLVQAVDATGCLTSVRRGIDVLASQSSIQGGFTLAIAAGLISNVTNNLPAGLIAGTSVAHVAGHDILRNATAIGIDLGPNLSVTGSLATVLWLETLRREGLHVSARSFFGVGAVVMPPALLLAVAALCVVTH